MGVSISYWIDCTKSKNPKIEFSTSEYLLERFGNNVYIYFENDLGLTSDNRWNTFIREYTQNTPHYNFFSERTIDYIKTNFAEAFGSTKILVIADSCFELHGKIEDMLYEEVSIDEIIKTVPSENVIYLKKEYSQEELDRIEVTSHNMIFIYEL